MQHVYPESRRASSQTRAIYFYASNSFFLNAALAFHASSLLFQQIEGYFRREFAPGYDHAVFAKVDSHATFSRHQKEPTNANHHCKMAQIGRASCRERC